MRNIKFSQNFVKNQGLIESLIKASSISRDDLVFDIGAGTGEITDILRKFCKEVIAIEKDKNCTMTCGKDLNWLRTFE